MTMARSVEQHLNRVGVSYDLVPHPHSQTSKQSARAAHLSPRQVAKAVLTRDGDNYQLCVIPASHRIVFPWLNSYMRGHFRLVSEEELKTLFSDCEVGAVPALGQVYGFPVIWDNSLIDTDDIYIESGDHENLIHVNHAAFMELMGLQNHMTISCPEDDYSDYMVM